MKKLQLTTLVCIFIMFPLLINGQDPVSCEFNYGVYSARSHMPVKASAMASGVIDGKIYLAGGWYFDQNGEVILPDHISVYDPETNTWDTTGAHLPESRLMDGAHNIALDGKLYLIGGVKWIQTGEDVWQGIAYARVDVYDPQSDTWESKQELPVPLGAAGVCIMDGKFYVTGGGTDVSNILNSFYSYDPETDKWTELTEMPGPRCYHSSVALNGKIYVIGGEIGTPVALASCEVYDPDSAQWTPIAPLPIGIWGPAACVVDGEIYVFGGARWVGGHAYLLGESYKYNPEEDTWLEMHEFNPRCQELTVIPIGRTIYLMGGRTSGSTTSNLVQAFELSDVCLDICIPDTTIDGSVIEVHLSDYFSHVDGGDIVYSVCNDDTDIISTELNGSTLTITGLSSGTAEVSILAESGADQMGDVFKVHAELTGIEVRCESTPFLSVYPNPSRGMTTLEYSVQSPGIVRLEVKDLMGKRVAILINDYQEPGEYEYLFNTGELEPGIYFCDLTSATGRAIVKLIVAQ